MNISRFLLYCVFNDSSPAGLCRYQIKDALSPCLYPVYGVYGDQDRQQDCSVSRHPPELSASASLCAVFRQEGDGYMLTLLCCSSSVTMSRLPEFPPAPCSQHCTIIGL